MKAQMITKFLGIMIVLVIPFLMFSFNLLLFFNPVYLKWEYSKENFPRSIIFADGERLELSQDVLQYIKNIDEVFNPESFGLFTQREIRHLNDVKILTKKLNLIRNISLIFFAKSVIFFILIRRKKYQIISYIFLGFLITSAVFLLFLGFILLNFDFLFIKFHEILFPQGFWTFQPQDTLIQLYPKRFWIDTTILFFLSLFIETLILSSLSGLIMLHLKEGKLK